MTEALTEPLIGTYDHTIDGKGRVVLPQAYRRLFQDGVHLSDRGAYLAVYPSAEWRRYAQLLEERCLAGQFSRDSLYEVFARTVAATMDSQGRVLLDKKQRDELGLEGDVRFRGHGNHLALFPRPVDGAPVTTAPDIRDIVAELSAIGL